MALNAMHQGGTVIIQNHPERLDPDDIWSTIARERATFRARGFANLYPVGEGAGYAGGIMSAALDGANAAQAWLRLGAGTPRVLG